nr:MAG TPA: hypothetical protein [Caudoviricetes sp.]
MTRKKDRPVGVKDDLADNQSRLEGRAFGIRIIHLRAGFVKGGYVNGQI